jgi:hypothetical protein
MAIGSKVHLSSVDTLASLLDRLVAEQVKRLHYLSHGQTDDVVAQSELVDHLTGRITELLRACLADHQYDFIEERRTFAVQALPQKLRDMVAHSFLLGAAETEKLRLLLQEPHEDSSLFLLALIARLANEWRASSRRQLDDTLRQLLE